MGAVLIHALLAFALVVVVPFAAPLAPGRHRVPLRDHAVAGGIAAVSFALPPGTGAAVLVLPWLGVAIYIAARKIAQAPSSIAAAGGFVASVYMVIGASWLVLSRYGARPLGSPDEIVELTAVHFHYAGFVAPVLALRALAWTRSRGARIAGHLALATIVAGMPLTALGFTVSPRYGTAGAISLTVGLLVLSVVTLATVVPGATRPASAALGISSSSVLVAMALAVVYSLGRWTQVPAPSIEVMAWTHGLLNAVGFSFFGVAGWHLLDVVRKAKPPLR